MVRSKREFLVGIILQFVQRVTDCQLSRNLAIGNPVALEARAELLDTRGFISMTTIRPFSGLVAN